MAMVTSDHMAYQPNRDRPVSMIPPAHRCPDCFSSTPTAKAMPNDAKECVGRQGGVWNAIAMQVAQPAEARRCLVNDGAVIDTAARYRSGAPSWRLRWSTCRGRAGCSTAAAPSGGGSWSSEPTTKHNHLGDERIDPVAAVETLSGKPAYPSRWVAVQNGRLAASAQAWRPQRP